MLESQPVIHPPAVAAPEILCDQRCLLDPDHIDIGIAHQYGWASMPERAQTAMRLSLAVDWPMTTVGAKFRRVGWLDQKGRVWTGTPGSRDFDGGSLTPLLVQLDDD